MVAMAPPTSTSDPMEDFLNRERAALEEIGIAGDIQAASTALPPLPPSGSTSSSSLSIESLSRSSTALPGAPMNSVPAPITAQLSPNATLAGMEGLRSASPSTTAAASDLLLHQSAAPRGAHMSVPNVSRVASMSDFGSSNGINNNNNGTAPTAAAMAVPRPGTATSSSRSSRPDTAALQGWRETQGRKLAENDIAESKVRQHLQEKATADLAAFYADYNKRVAERQAACAASSHSASNDDDSLAAINDASGSKWNWKHISKLVETLPRPSKDASRLLEILHSLGTAAGTDQQQPLAKTSNFMDED